MSLPSNAAAIVEDIMWCASRFRSMADSELIKYAPEAEQNIMKKIMDELFPYISSNLMHDSVLIDACGRFLSQPSTLLFYNIITLYYRTPALHYIMVFMANRGEDYVPYPDVKWVASV